MMASIFGLKRSHIRYNVALVMPTNAASIVVLNDVTLGYLVCDLLTTPYVVVVYLNLDYWEGPQNGSRGKQLGLPRLGLSWPQRASIIFLMYDLYRRFSSAI